MKRRCAWAGTDPIYVEYHDTEWGVPVHDDRKLFEFLILEGAQAGLSWLTILKRRAHYRQAFAGFVVEDVARFGEREIEGLMANPGIIRNRLKVRSAVANAREFMKIQGEFGSFDAYSRQFIDGARGVNRWESAGEIPAKTDESVAFSRDLKKRGFSFVGPTIIYAHMEAVGMVNDHTIDCFRYREVMALYNS